jgi:sialate O-acetylesterase
MSNRQNAAGTAIVSALLGALACVAAPTNAVPDVVTNAPPLPEFRLPHLFGDNMVLQRERPVPIWGWAAAGEKVVVSFAGQKVPAQADAAGRWSATLAAMPAGGPFELQVSGKSNIVCTNVLVGEVWVCSGQSNMEFPLRTALSGLERESRGKGLLLSTQELAQALGKAKGTVANCRKLSLRWMTVDQIDMKNPKYREPQGDCGGTWQVCDEKTALTFSATAFYFGEELARELQVPVGLICSAFGGTGIRQWTPECEIAQDAKHKVRQPAGVLYNGMVVPLMPLAMRGVIWYQGESDALGHAAGYHERMQALVSGWRKAWGIGDFPFYYVQIAPYSGYRWWQHAFWESQTAALAITNSGMVVTTDIDCNEDIHPPHKQPIGHRLALLALARTYGRDKLVCDGPQYKSFAVEGNRIRIAFRHAEGGLASRDGKPIDLFTIAGEDKKFFPARAEIDGETVVVSSDEVAKPAAVRYAARSGVFVSNLMNQSGLPAVPFRTDAW